jgi:hypothetical protein
MDSNGMPPWFHLPRERMPAYDQKQIRLYVTGCAIQPPQRRAYGGDINDDDGASSRNDQCRTWISYSAVLLASARGAYARTWADGQGQEALISDAVAAIVLSAVSVDAYVNELARIASACGSGGDRGSRAWTTANMLDEAEKANAPTPHKMRPFCLAATVESLDERSTTIHDYMLLAKLKDALTRVRSRARSTACRRRTTRWANCWTTWIGRAWLAWRVVS